jgi:Zn-dependent M28 family amino/carboxypeptidase
MARLLEHNVPVTVELNVQVKITPPTTPNSFNVIGEIPGTDKANEVVLLGAHFDSWHAATGATDNAAGVAALMEAMRIIQASGLRPRRTVRLALWGAEELGLNGSETYVRDHLGSAAQPTAERDRFAAYFNLDNGTGRIRGVWMQDNPAVEPIFRAWIAPLGDLGVTILSPRSVVGTDHESFDAVGLPAFQFVQERYEYNSRTHHSNMDFFDRLQADDLRQAATVAAVFAWHAAVRDEILPRNAASRTTR